jgi:outer membrane protein insertion porin family
MGNVYGPDEKLDLSTLRSSLGAGVTWISPLGPMRLAYTHPLRKFSGDRIEKIQFQIGTSF